MRGARVVKVHTVLHFATLVVFVLIVVDMLFKPGA